MDERRQLPRWEVKKEVSVLIPLTQGFSQGTIEDVHLKGMCISFNRQLPQQQTVKMSFTLEDNFDFIKIEAEIPWMKEVQGRYVYGLSFTKIDDEYKDRIYRYITANCYDQFRKNWWGKSVQPHKEGGRV